MELPLVSPPLSAGELVIATPAEGFDDATTIWILGTAGKGTRDESCLQPAASSSGATRTARKYFFKLEIGIDFPSM